MKQINFMIMIVILILLFISCSNEPKRPQHVSENSFWKGGPKFGYWFDVLDKKNNQIRIKIYDDYTGKLVEDSFFELENKCSSKHNLNKDLINKHLLFYDSEIILLEIDSVRCKLVPVRYKDKYFRKTPS